MKKGDDIGRGVKSRILELFDELADASTAAAAEAANTLLLQCFREVELELQQVRKDLEIHWIALPTQSCKRIADAPKKRI